MSPEGRRFTSLLLGAGIAAAAGALWLGWWRSEPALERAEGSAARGLSGRSVPRAPGSRIGDPALPSFEPERLRGSPTGRLVVELVTLEGQAVEGGWVLVESLDDGAGSSEGKPRPKRAVENGTGRFVVEGLPRGEHIISAAAPGLIQDSEWIRVPVQASLRMALSRGLTASGRVLTTGKVPIPGAAVWMRRRLKDFLPTRSSTDAEGRFLLDGLPPLRGVDYQVVRVEAQGFAPVELNIGDRLEDIEIYLPAEAVYSGIVLDGKSGEPIAGAEVSFGFAGSERLKADTDLAGRFEVRGIPPGIHDVSVDHDHYPPIEDRGRELREGQEVRGVEFRLRRGFSRGGKVVDVRTGLPVPEASMLLRGEEVFRSARSDGNGRFEFTGLKPGEFQLSGRARGYIEAEAIEVEISGEAPADLSLSLERGGVVGGRVLDHSGRPLAGARIDLDALETGQATEEERRISKFISHSDRFSALADEEGSFRFEGLLDFDSYAVVASHPHHASGVVERVAAGPGLEPSQVEVVLGRGATVRGSVRDARGRGIAGASVGVQPKEDPEKRDRPKLLLRDASYCGRSDSRYFSVNPEGEFEIKGLPPGEYLVSASVEGLAFDDSRSLRVEDGEVLDGLDFVPRPGQVLTGRVVDPGGIGIKGSDIHTGSVSATTAADGRFRLEGLDDGETSIQVRKSGFKDRSIGLILPTGEVTIALEPLARVLGRVLAPGVVSLPSGKVEVLSLRELGEDEPPLPEAWTEGDGRFDLEVDAGSFFLVARIPGYVRLEKELVLSPGERRDLELTLEPGGAIRGKVISTDTGKDVSSVCIYLKTAEGGHGGAVPMRESTDSDGLFAFECAPAGISSLAAVERGFRIARAESIPVRAGETAEVRIHLVPGRGIHGEVRRGGRSLADAVISVRKADGSIQRETRSAPDGLWEVADLLPGDYEVSAEAKGPDRTLLHASRRAEVPGWLFFAEVALDLEP